MTYGALRFRLSKAFPGVDPDLLDGWIQDVYADILSELPWSRQQITSTLEVVAPYTTGTIAVASGSTSLALTGGTWTSAMTGRAIRIANRNEYYEFTRTGDTTGTLDRGYEGADDETAASYSVFQFVYPLPSDCRLLQDDAFPSMTRLSGPQMDADGTVGTPLNWASYMDDNSTPPRMQIEIYPIPDTDAGIPFTYTAETDTLGSTTAAMKAWIQPSALIEGVTAKIKGHLRDYVGAAHHYSLCEKALSKMRGSEADGSGPTTLQLSSHYTSHRRRRW